VAYPPHPGEDNADRIRLVRIWARETAEFKPEVVVDAFHELLTNNPRNPFRPSVQDIVARCKHVRAQWEDRARKYYLAESDNKPPEWCSDITREVLRSTLQGLCHECARPALGRSPCIGLSDGEQRGWRMAKRIGARISQWPTDLLTEFGVPAPEVLNRIQAVVDAENARLDDAMAAAMARPEVKRAFEATRAADQRSPSSGESHRAHRTFVDLHSAAVDEELKRRGLVP